MAKAQLLLGEGFAEAGAPPGAHGFSAAPAETCAAVLRNGGVFIHYHPESDGVFATGRCVGDQSGRMGVYFAGWRFNAR
jgi:hypothetical protein